jgi:UDP-3-O-[3-hydroxymyristoyl] glucosamine N-acyltransferase
MTIDSNTLISSNMTIDSNTLISSNMTIDSDTLMSSNMIIDTSIALENLSYYKPPIIYFNIDISSGSNMY